MRTLLSQLLLMVFGTAALGAGCTPRPAQAPEDDGPLAGRDSVIHVDPGPQPTDMLTEQRTALSGGAAYDTLTVGELGVAAATNETEREAAERALGSGAYLGDPVPVVRFTSEGGAARAELDANLGAPFESDFFVRFDQAQGGVVDVVVEGEAVTGGRAMPSVLGIEFDLRAERPSVAITLNRPGGIASEIARAHLPGALADDLAVQFGIRYVPGTVSVVVNGEQVLEAVGRLGGGPASATLRLTGGSATLLRWTLE